MKNGYRNDTSNASDINHKLDDFTIQASTSYNNDHNSYIQLSSNKKNLPERIKELAINKSTYPIGSIELVVCYAIWIAHSLAAIVITVHVSRYGAGQWMEHWMTPSNYVEGYKMDNSDLEWKLFRETIAETVLVYSIHFVVFRIITKYISPKISSIFLIVFWLALHIYLTSSKCMLFLAGHVLVTTSATIYTRRESVAWFICSAFMLGINNWAPFSGQPGLYYREFNLYLYTSIRVLNYCIHICRQKRNSEKLHYRNYVNYAEYLLYPIYSSALIVLYKDFRTQITHMRETICAPAAVLTTNFKEIIWLALRLVFWMYFLDGALHFCRVNAFFNSPFTMLRGLHNYELAAVAYIAGQFFHVKYVVIFGVPRFFALADGFVPPRAPICISRVSKYSQMWRYFDQGLYEFLKKQVYIPLMTENTNNQSWIISLVRKLLATVMVFTFVLLWHGISPNYFYWVLLSGLELAIERIGHLVSKYQTVIFLKTSIGPSNWIRLKAISMLATVVPGIFGVFFFLGRTGIGETIFRRVLCQGLWQIITLQIGPTGAGFVLLHLFVIGYFFNHACLHLETIFEGQKKKKKIDEKVE